MNMCFNWKVAAGLAAVAVGIVIVAPRLTLAALPVLALAVCLAICPLSMLVMMWAMGRAAGGTRCTDAGPPRPVELLQERYVRGAIGLEEYEAALDRLLAGPRPPVR